MTRRHHGQAQVPRTDQLLSVAEGLLNDALRIDCADPRFQELVVTRVLPDGGLRRLVAVFGPTPHRPVELGGVREAQELFEAATGFFRSVLAEALQLRRAPQLRFLPDPERWAAYVVRAAERARAAAEPDAPEAAGDEQGPLSSC